MADETPKGPRPQTLGAALAAFDASQRMLAETLATITDRDEEIGRLRGTLNWPADIEGHSPLPWRRGAGGADTLYSGTVRLARFYAQPEQATSAIDLANAALAMLAVNERPALLAERDDARAAFAVMEDTIRILSAERDALRAAGEEAAKSLDALIQWGEMLDYDHTDVIEMLDAGQDALAALRKALNGGAE